jgi:hypothetical protein
MPFVGINQNTYVRTCPTLVKDKQRFWHAFVGAQARTLSSGIRRQLTRLT